MKNEVFWKNPKYRIRKHLQKDLDCNYLVVGGGVTGVSTAYFLAKRGIKNIVLIEKDFIASGATGRAAGVLTPHTDQLCLHDLMKIYGKTNGLLFWYNTLSSLHHVKNIIRKEKIDCDFEEEPTIAAEFNYKTFDNVLEEYKVTKEAHISVKLLLKKELEKEVHTKIFKEGILSHKGISINPLKYTQNLSKKLEKLGVKVYENTPLIDIENSIAKTPKGNINFNKIILARDVDNKISKVKAVKTTIAVSQKLKKNQLKQIGFIHKKMLWDTKKDYDYLKLTKDGRLLIGFGDLKISLNENKTKLNFKQLKQIQYFIQRLFPQINIKLEYSWSGTLGVGENSIPYFNIENNKIIIGGNGTQVISTMMANYITNKLQNKKVSLDRFFQNSKVD